MLNKRLWRCFCEKVVLAAQQYQVQKKIGKIQKIFLTISFVQNFFKFLFRLILMVSTTYIFSIKIGRELSEKLHFFEIFLLPS